MKNIKNYENFINEEINLGWLKNNLKYYSINSCKHFLANVLILAVTILRVFSKNVKKNMSIEELKHLVKNSNKAAIIVYSLIHKNVLNIEKMEENDIISLFKEIRKEYNKKYKNRNFDDDIKVALDRWGLKTDINDKHMEDTIIRYLDLSKKIEDISNGNNLDIDPYGEDDWRDEDLIEFIPISMFNHNDNIPGMNLIKNLIVDKTIIFNREFENDNISMFNGLPFRTKVKVARVNFVFNNRLNRPKKMIIIDNDHKRYKVNLNQTIEVVG